MVEVTKELNKGH